MKAIEADYSEQYLLPPRIEDWLPKDHPARFIREVVVGLDLKQLGIRTEVAAEGRPPYAASLLLRVWLYGYWERIRSSRGLERACRDQISFIWLCGNRAPDHNTLWRFFQRNKPALREVFRTTVKTALKLDLVGLALQAVDGTKIEAVCSSRGGSNERALREHLQKIEEEIAQLEKAIEEAQDKDSGDSDHLPKSLQDARQLRTKVTEALKAVTEGQTRHCQPHEPQARRMHGGGRNRFGYNAQTVVDERAQIIVAAEVVNAATDEEQLVPMSEAAAENTGTRQVKTLADGGYGSSAAFAEAESKGLEVLSKLPASSRNEAQNPYHASRFRFDAERDVFICPEGRAISFQRLRKRRGQDVRVYRSAKTCAGCPVRAACTSAAQGRTVEHYPGHEALERMRTKLQAETEFIKQRSRIIEPVFAQLKSNRNFWRWTYKGLEGVRAQWAMLCSVWNLSRIYRMWRASRSGGPNGTNPNRLKPLHSAAWAMFSPDFATCLET